MLITLYADDVLEGLVTTDSRLQSTPLIGVLAEALARDKVKEVGPSPHPSLKDCERILA